MSEPSWPRSRARGSVAACTIVMRELHPSFLDYPAMTTRVIPVVVLRRETSPVTP